MFCIVREYTQEKSLLNVTHVAEPSANREISLDTNWHIPLWSLMSARRVTKPSTAPPTFTLIWELMLTSDLSSAICVVNHFNRRLTWKFTFIHILGSFPCRMVCNIFPSLYSMFFNLFIFFAFHWIINTLKPGEISQNLPKYIVVTFVSWGRKMVWLAMSLFVGVNLWVLTVHVSMMRHFKTWQPAMRFGSSPISIWFLFTMYQYDY